MGRPQGQPAQGLLEGADGGHDHRVDHLLMELRVALRGRQAVLGHTVRVVEIDRLVKAAAGRIDIDHLQILSDRSRFQCVFPGNGERGPVDRIGFHVPAQRWIEGKGPQPAVGRLGWPACGPSHGRRDGRGRQDGFHGNHRRCGRDRHGRGRWRRNARAGRCKGGKGQGPAKGVPRVEGFLPADSSQVAILLDGSASQLVVDGPQHPRIGRQAHVLGAADPIDGHPLQVGTTIGNGPIASRNVGRLQLAIGIGDAGGRGLAGVVAQDDRGPVVEEGGINPLPPGEEGCQPLRFDGRLPKILASQVVLRLGQPGQAVAVPGQQLVDSAHRLHQLLEAVIRGHHVRADLADQIVVAGQGEGGRERAEVGWPEQDQVGQPGAHRVRAALLAQPLQRPAGNQRRLRVSDQVDRLAGGIDQPGEVLLEPLGGAVQVLAPIDREESNTVASRFQVGTQQVVQDRQSPGRLDLDLRIEVLLRLGVGSQLQQAEPITEGHDGVDPDQAKPLWCDVAEHAAEEAGHDHDQIGAEEKAQGVSRDSGTLGNEVGPALGVLQQFLDVLEHVGADQLGRLGQGRIGRLGLQIEAEPGVEVGGEE